MGKKSKKAKTPKPTAQEIALANRSKKQFELYKRLYRPLHKELLARTAATPERRAIARGIVNADIQQASKKASGNLLARGLAGGISGHSNRSILARGAQGVARSAVGASGAARATQGVNTRDLQGRINFARIGLGVVGQNLQSQAQLARTATAGAIQDAQLDAARSDAIATGLGNFAGFATGTQGGLDNLNDMFSFGSARPQFALNQLDAGGRSMR